MLVGLDQNSDGRCHEVEESKTHVHTVPVNTIINNTQSHTTQGLPQDAKLPSCLSNYLNQPIRENSVKFLSCRPSHKPAPGECGQQASRSFEVRPKQDKTSGPAVKRESSTPRPILAKAGKPSRLLGPRKNEGYSTGSKP